MVKLNDWRMAFGICVLAIVLVVGVVYGGIVLLNKHTAKEQFQCASVVYNDAHKLQDHNNLKLSVNINQDKVIFDYDYYSGQDRVGGVTLHGSLESIHVSDMTYDFIIHSGELDMDLTAKNIPAEIVRVLDQGRKALNLTNNQLPLAMQVSQVFKQDNQVFIRFMPGNNIWSCQKLD
ncbi:hypothetical protein FJQ87_16205 [Shewanella sp. SNU WT4]|uniref:hypothetical protein n=1 Tax=Shewanella sp. SNU WT4 TaxID=2590015 RepID=UPI00112D56AC|nr:hypothetical protein [Shewanella sp. SNU WT4]QDF67996.1 hypothetical protein FJQ87_16205 [Shewanella sp. SNU WT4]